MRDEKEEGIGPENLLSARERLVRKGRLEMSSESVPVRVREERLMEMTWRCWPHVMPCQEQYGVFGFHEERIFVGSLVMEDDLNDSNVWYSEIMCVVETELNVRRRKKMRYERRGSILGERNGEEWSEVVRV
jgi:hypothetical protein